MPAPNRLRLALLAALAVYPLVTLLLYAVQPFTLGWPLWQRTLIVVPLMVAAMIWVVLPIIQARFGGWIAGSRRPAVRRCADAREA